MSRVDSITTEEGTSSHLPLPNTTPITPTKSSERGARLKRELIQNPDRIGIKNHVVAAAGEYVGTTLFLFFALAGTNVANLSVSNMASGANVNVLLYISLSFGMSLAANAWIFFRVSGGLFNPAVSLALSIVGAITPLRGVILTFAQLLGGITAAALAQVLFPGPLKAGTRLGGGISVSRGLFLEMFLTCVLCSAVLFMAAEKHKATHLAPVGIGLSLFIAEMTGVYWTGGSLNPARSFGPDVATRSFPGYHWIYWLGPCLGAVISAFFYKLIKFFEFETVCPDQDALTTILTATPTSPSSDATHVDCAKHLRKMSQATVVNNQGASMGMMSDWGTNDKAMNFEKRGEERIEHV